MVSRKTHIMTKDEFIANVVNELITDKFSVYLHQKVKVEDCGGWFGSTDREFTVAMDNPMGFEIFIHEYSHYRQWKDHREWFEKKNNGNGIFFGWLGGDDYIDSIVELAHKETVALELHCEQQSLWLIEQHDLPVDVDKYTKAANAYLLCYQFIKAKRLWTKKSPYNNEMVLKYMPTELQPFEYYLNPANIPDEVKTYFEECFIE